MQLFSRPGPLLVDTLEVLVELLHPGESPLWGREWSVPLILIPGWSMRRLAADGMAGWCVESIAEAQNYGQQGKSWLALT